MARLSAFAREPARMHSFDQSWPKGGKGDRLTSAASQSVRSFFKRSYK